MRKKNFELEYEDQSINGFLGLDVSKTGTGNDNAIKDTMAWCIGRLLDLTRMNDFIPKDNTAIQTALGLDIDVTLAKKMIRGAIQTHQLCPNIYERINSLILNCPFTRSPVTIITPNCQMIFKLSASDDYPKVTRDKGLVLNPTNFLQMYCYVDAYFEVLWNIKTPEEYISFK